MLYKISSVDYYEIEELIDEYPCLKEFNFRTHEDDFGGFATIVINSVKDLNRLIELVEHDLIVSSSTIIIYDGWIE